MAKLQIGLATGTKANIKTDKAEKLAKMLLDIGFHNQQKGAYRLWKLKQSIATLYVRTYSDRLECYMLGDFDPYVYLRLKYEDVFKRLDLGESLLVILLSDNIK